MRQNKGRGQVKYWIAGAAAGVVALAGNSAKGFSPAVSPLTPVLPAPTHMPRQDEGRYLGLRVVPAAGSPQRHLRTGPAPSVIRLPSPSRGSRAMSSLSRRRS